MDKPLFLQERFIFIDLPDPGFYILSIHDKYIYRCIQLAKLGSGTVAPNPMVGAVLVYKDRIIGEGWHQVYGKAHAEVNCIKEAIQHGHSHLFSESVMYVSLEPCAHHGKTPPCCDLIIKNKIPKVVIGCRDPFEEVNGKGIEKLKQHGVSVEVADRLIRYECEQLNKRFFTFHIKKRPFVVLKWAQTEDGFIAASLNNGRLLISNEYSNRLVHKWRSEEAGILVGTNTALADDPELTTRWWTGKSPVRLVVDMDLKLPASLRMFDQRSGTIIFNAARQEEKGNLLYYKLKKSDSIIPQILDALYQLNIQSIMVEGGAKLLQSFIDEQAWDEIRILTNEKKQIGAGLQAPKLENAVLVNEERLYSDTIELYVPVASS
jgi:diaminohydroxyphosphoribosylaminopyrimidine deaminase/5-amino-6-(5-phosphoribosylamino)uracil reductase